MIIQTGNPIALGRYACFLGNDRAPTVIQWWYEDRWFVNDGSAPLKKPITAWIGPLPTRPIMEFDL